MAYNDEPEYYDDDDVEYYDDDDESYIDYSDNDDDEDGGSRRSSVRGSISPFSSGSSGLPGSSSRLSGSSRFSSSGSGSSRFGSRFGSDEDEDEDGGSSRFRSPSSSSSTAPGYSRFGNRLNSEGDESASSRLNKDDLRSRLGGASGGTSSGPSRFGSRFNSSERDEESSGSASSSRLSRSSDSSSYSGSRLGSNSSRASSKPADDSDNKPSSRYSGSRISSSSSQAASKPAEKAQEAPKANADDSKKDSTGGGLTSRLSSLRNALPLGGSSDDSGDKKPAAKKDDAQKDETASGGLFGSIRSALPIGGSSDDGGDKKPAAKKDDAQKDESASGGGLFGSIRSALPIGGSSDDGDNTETKASGSSSPFSRLRSNKAAEDKPAKKDNKATPKTAAKGGKQTSFGKKSSAGKKDTGSKKGTKAAAAKTENAAGPLAGITASIGGIFGRGNQDAKSSKSSKSRAKASSKVPTAAEDGLTLDNWLDILGVALVFSSLVLFFSAISAEQAVISRVHVTLGQLFGWGAAAVPIAMFIIGMWLIVRHFGDDAPKIDPVRIIGVVIAFVSLLVIFQYIDSFNVERYGVTTTYEQLRLQLGISWRVFRAGGGVIGAELYYFLLTTVTEIGGFLLITFTLLVGLMLMLRLSASEIALFFVGMWRNMRDGMSQRARERRAKRQLATQKAAEIAAQRAQERSAAQQASAQPEPSVVPQVVAATAAAGAVASDPGIRFNFGGQAQAAPANQSYTPTVPIPQTQPAPRNSGGGFFSRFRGGNNSAATNQPQPPPLLEPLPLDDGTILPPAYQPQQPPVPPAMPQQQPAARAESTPSIGDLMRQPDAPDGSATETTVPDATEDDPVTARIERLNALRRGEIGELSQSALARARKDDLEAAFVPESEATREGSYSAFGKPEDIPTHESEKIPYADNGNGTRPSQLPSAQPDGDSGPRQQPLSVPVSSPVQRQGRPRPQWQLPDYRTLLSAGGEQEFDRELLLKQAKTIEDTLAGFGAPGRVVEVNTGPVVTQFGVEPDYLTGRNGRKQRVKVSAIASLDRDLQLALGARSIRVEAPVPGKGYVGIEIPNAEPSLVGLRDVMESAGFQKIKSPLAIALGQSVSGAPISADLASMPHVLIAGTTGSGKSVCVNSIIASILSTNTPEQVKFIMVDPKRVELTGYNGIPHLVAPVVVELERIVGVLKWVTREMDERYKKFSEAGARNIEDYNGHINPDAEEPMPYIVVIIDELADLMMLAPEETERTITRIAALARATGIHLVIATQRPSVDVVTGLIKANFPARVAFAVAGSVDSRVILDQPGAERLLGKGDMLYLSGSSPAPLRMQGVFVSDMEITNLVRYWKMQAVQQPSSNNLMTKPRFAQAERTAVPDAPPARFGGQQAFWDSDEPLPSFATGSSYGDDADDDDDVELTQRELTGNVKDGNEDELYDKAVELVRRLDKASISLLQRRLRIGYTRAARLIDVMEARGVVGPAKEGSSKPRDVLPE